MRTSTKMSLKISWILIHTLLGLAIAQDSFDAQDNYLLERKGNDVMFCVTSMEELTKCQELSETVTKDQKLSEFAFGSYYRNILCKRYTSKDECMKLIDEGSSTSPNIMSVDAGDVFVGGRYHSLVPITREVYDNNEDFVHSVAVIKKGSLPFLNTMHDLRGLKACFPKVGALAGWTIPIYKLIEYGAMSVEDCNNHVKSAIQFFGDSCAVGSLENRYNPLGDNPNQFCELCGSDTPGVRCKTRDPYADNPGALLCLQEKGDIAFTTEKALYQSGINLDEYELLCPPLNALVRKPVSAYKECSWGVAPGNAIVVSSAMDMEERLNIQILLEKINERYGAGAYVDENNDSKLPEYDTNSNNYVDDDDDDKPNRPFRLNESSPRYGNLKNLLFNDNVKRFAKIKSDEMTYKDFLGKSYGNDLVPPNVAIDGVRKCPVGKMTLCVTSEAEMVKCVRMKTALNAQLLEPKMTCRKSDNAKDCMRLIAFGEADVTVLEAGDIYHAGWRWGLVPVMAEVYNLGSPFYYAVAVTKQRDNHTELIYLKNLRTCHPAVDHGGGWVIPMAWLLTNERVRDYGCNSLRAAAEYFNEACAPGATSGDYDTRDEAHYWEFNHLCDLCHGTAGFYCKRNHMEDYFGHTGAFRCLVEGGGNVAFIKHTTVMENCDGKRKEWWARNQLTTDYELLCRDGTRAPARNYENCYVGKVKSNAIVVNPGIGETRLNAYINLFKYAQQFYGQKVVDEFSFSMFQSHPPFADLIFQDATQQLVVLPKEERHYTKYLDEEFLKAYTVVECRSGVDSKAAFSLSIMVVISVLNILF